MAELVDVKNRRPVVEKITVELTVTEARDLALAHKQWWGGSSPISRLLEESTTGVRKPKTLTDYLAASVMGNRF